MKLPTHLYNTEIKNVWDFMFSSSNHLHVMLCRQRESFDLYKRTTTVFNNSTITSVQDRIIIHGQLN